jgi:hypothetical protein
MRKTLGAAVLVVAFCCPVSAGIIHNPPPEPVLMPETTDVTGAETPAPGVSDSLKELTLDLLAVLPALL